MGDKEILTDSDTKVTLNIGGQRITTLASTLKNIPGTRISNLTTDDPSYDQGKQEYYFDRNPQMFPYILDAFREGEFHFPRCVCAPTIHSELSYWGLAEDRISACCWKACCDWEEEQKTLSIINDAYSGPRAQLEELTGGSKHSWKSRMIHIWLFLEDPHSSKKAQVWFYFYLLLLVLSTVSIALGTVAELRVPVSNDFAEVMDSSWNTSNPKIDMYHKTQEHAILRYIQSVCSLFFVLELVVHFLTSPSKLRFFCSFFNIVDILAIIPMFIFVIMNSAIPNFWIRNNLEIAYNVVGVSSVFRIVRVLKMVKHNRGLQVIFLAIKASMKEMLLLALLVVIGMLIFSTSIYYAELYTPDSFESIPVGLWWSIITMTTVGYGDVVPFTTWGYVIGGLCALSGILITGLPIPVIANNFSLYYTYANLKTKLEQRNIQIK